MDKELKKKLENLTKAEVSPFIKKAKERRNKRLTSSKLKTK